MKPTHISDKCDCGELLQQTPGFDDDWVCHSCNIAYLDWPKEELDAFHQEIDRRIKELDKHPERSIPWSVVRKKLRKRLEDE